MPDVLAADFDDKVVIDALLPDGRSWSVCAPLLNNKKQLTRTNPRACWKAFAKGALGQRIRTPPTPVRACAAVSHNIWRRSCFGIGPVHAERGASRLLLECALGTWTPSVPTDRRRTPGTRQQDVASAGALLRLGTALGQQPAMQSLPRLRLLLSPSRPQHSTARGLRTPGRVEHLLLESSTQWVIHDQAPKHAKLLAAAGATQSLPATHLIEHLPGLHTRQCQCL